MMEWDEGGVFFMALLKSDPHETSELCLEKR